MFLLCFLQRDVPFPRRSMLQLVTGGSYSTPVAVPVGPAVSPQGNSGSYGRSGSCRLGSWEETGNLSLRVFERGWGLEATQEAETAQGCCCKCESWLDAGKRQAGYEAEATQTGYHCSPGRVRTESCGERALAGRRTSIGVWSRLKAAISL
jgi:hypothetical protein